MTGRSGMGPLSRNWLWNGRPLQAHAEAMTEILITVVTVVILVALLGPAHRRAASRGITHGQTLAATYFDDRDVTRWEAELRYCEQIDPFPLTDPRAAAPHEEKANSQKVAMKHRATPASRTA